MKKMNDLFCRIVNQSKYIHEKHNCGESENLFYMATELKKEFENFLEDKSKKILADIKRLNDVIIQLKNL